MRRRCSANSSFAVVKFFFFQFSSFFLPPVQLHVMYFRLWEKYLCRNSTRTKTLCTGNNVKMTQINQDQGHRPSAPASRTFGTHRIALIVLRHACTRAFFRRVAVVNGGSGKPHRVVLVGTGTSLPKLFSTCLLSALLRLLCCPPFFRTFTLRTCFSEDPPAIPGRGP